MNSDSASNSTDNSLQAPTSVSAAHIETRLLRAQWVLERNLSWIAAAEVKLGVIIAIDTAMLGVVGSALSIARADNRSAWALAWSLTAIIILAISLVCASAALFPRVTGPANSLVFFGTIAKLNIQDFQNDFINASPSDLLADWTDQIHRNAEIAATKFTWVSRSMIASLLAITPWFFALVLLLRK